MRLQGKDEDAKERWTIARWMMWQEMLLSPNIKAFNKPKTPQAFCRFPWEESTEEELKRKVEEYRITPEQEAELNRIMQEWEASKEAPQPDTDNEQDR